MLIGQISLKLGLVTNAYVSNFIERVLQGQQCLYINFSQQAGYHNWCYASNFFGNGAGYEATGASYSNFIGRYWAKCNRGKELKFLR
jgi:hypothetical protein